MGRRLGVIRRMVAGWMKRIFSYRRMIKRVYVLEMRELIPAQIRAGYWNRIGRILKTGLFNRARLSRARFMNYACEDGEHIGIRAKATCGSIVCNERLAGCEMIAEEFCLEIRVQPERKRDTT